MTYEEKVQSKWTWNRLRVADRMILCRKAGFESPWSTSQNLWEHLTDAQQERLCSFDWNAAFVAA